MDGRRRAATGRRSARGGWLPSLTTPSRLLEHHQRSLERRAAVVAAYRARRLRRMAAVPGGGGRPWESMDLIDARSRDVDLPGGGRLFVHEIAGPPGAATLVLLHGWRGTAAGNWATAMPALARDFHVVAPDLRGHDAASADDVMAMADALGVERFVAVGYSLGSAVAVRLGRHHPDRVAGLVLCAAAVSIPPAGTLGDVGDIPTAVVVTRQDRLIPEWRQLALARSLRGASVHPVDGNHFAFARADVFVPALLDACHSVARSPRGDRDLNV
ncbi:MAG: alpha/beta fold hydrolase [Ilumatobacteraceae bacterium]